MIQRWGNCAGRKIIDLSDLPVSAAVTETSLFANWMGCDFALDLANGQTALAKRPLSRHRPAMRQNQAWVAADHFR